MKKLMLSLLAATVVTQVTPALASAREEARLIECSGVLEELFAQRDTAIPEKLMAHAYGVAVIPNVVKVAAVVGGRRGSGAMVVRDENGKFSDPIMVSLTGGNIGWQIGVQSTDIVLVFTTRKGVEGIAEGKLTLGADASVAAGPVGRAASVGTDQNFSAEVYSYSRNRGLFAGVALDGSILAIDSRSNKKLYGKTAPAADIIARRVSTNAEAAKRFERAILASTAGGAPAITNASNAQSSPDPVTTQGTEDTAPAPSTGATTFPMEDTQPGAEPPR
ncbi:MAG TPA: lipid-binding SYLF domain-containing protein [Steroidobacteraceae bacterium]|nr:lipid-binding SYLF domain-containing protein [Steroidobacteraceae bacterium]